MTDIKEKTFIENILRRATLIIESQNDLTSAIDIFIDRGYSASLSEDDFLIYGITKAQFVNIADFVNNFNKFLDNDPTLIMADYRKILNILRTDK
jgi:hypothetical protein